MKDLQLINIDKASTERVADQAIRDVKDGHISALETHLKASCLEGMAKTIKDAIKQQALTEADTYGTGTRSCVGIEFNTKNGCVLPNLEADREYRERLRRLEETKEYKALKEREEVLKDAFKMAMKDKGQLIKDGEVIPVVPVKSTREGSIILK